MITEENRPPAEQTIVDVSKRVSRIVNESSLPTEGYKSTVGFFGGQLVYDKEGRMVYDNRGFVSRTDRWGDPKLRTYDEHKVKNPWKLLRKHPRRFLRFIHPGPKRYRGNTPEILEHITQLGLGGYYGSHAWGIEIKKPEVFKKGVALQDIFRQNLINASALYNLDRFQALGEATRYIASIHRNFGAIGEILPSDIIFQDTEGCLVRNPVLNIPDIVYNPGKKFGRTEQKATDMLDFLASMGVEEFRRSGDWNQTKQALQVIIENYDDPNVIHTAGSLAQRGRLTLQGLVFPLHNRVRLGINAINEDTTGQLRQLVVEACRRDKIITDVR